MKRLSRLRAWAGVAVGVFVLCLGSSASARAATPVIVDTDLFSSADDVGALATAYGLQLKGEASVIAVTLNTRTANGQHPVPTDTWKCAAAINDYYNPSGNVPIGTQTALGTPSPNDPDFVGPCGQLAPASQPAPQAAVSVMRQALASQADGSVVIVTTGYEGNLANLLKSPSDGISLLNGHDLVVAKVKTLVVMGGGYPSFSTNPGENNFYGDPADAKYVADNWPTKLVYSGEEIGNDPLTVTGQGISGSHPHYSPVRVAYEAFSKGPNNYIDSHDLTAVYHAIRPADTLLTESAAGTNNVNSGNGTNVFTLNSATVPAGTGNEFYLTDTNPSGLASAMNTLLDTTPGATSVTPPSNAGGLPTISGTAQIGQTLTASTGTWTGSPTSFSYQWLDCDATGNNCSAIPQHAIFSTYQVDSNWVTAGDTIKVQVWASVPGATSTVVESAATAPVLPAVVPPPTISVAPTISGTAREGQTLTAAPGTWNSLTTPSYSYQWQRCDGSACSKIDLATSQSYDVTSADVEHTIKVQVTATNSGGPGSPASSAATNVVLPLPPENVAPPSIAGVGREGETLTGHDGTWSHNPTGFTYQWKLCDASGAGCSAIDRATSRTYTPVGGDVGHTIKLAVTASNAGGTSGPTESAATAVVTSKPAPPATKPASTSPPVISGVATVGQKLSSSTGRWTGTAPMTTKFQWQRCRAGCVGIPGATGSSYTLSAADAGTMIRVIVTATNSAGGGQATSDKRGPVMPTVGKMRSLLAIADVARGRGAKIGNLLKTGGYFTKFAAPSSGRLQISWYYQPRRGKRVLVATVSVVLHKSGTANVKIALTRNGRNLLRASKSSRRLSSKSSFTPTGRGTISTSNSFTLKR
ncbi:MAG: nucleoside hydrolase [Solirubrobacteraceae bacterium]